MSDPAKPDPEDSGTGRGPTPVPPRGGKGKGGAKRPAPTRPAGKVSAKGPQARQAAQRRGRMYSLIAIAVVVVVIAVVVVIGVSSSGSNGPPRQPAPAAAVAQLQNITTATLVTGAQKVTALQFAATAAGPKLTQGGKPELLFIGAEFCPICGAERWPMTIALMKFGTFGNLQQTHSAKADGNVGTWSYEGTTYTSKYLAFTSYELYTNQRSGSFYKTLDKLPADANAVWTANLGSNLTFPFVDFGGKEVLETAQYSPLSVYNKSFSDILGAVGSNDNTIGAAVDASAAVFTKYLCGMTGNQPSDVCSAVASVTAPVTPSSSGSSTPAGG